MYTRFAKFIQQPKIGDQKNDVLADVFTQANLRRGWKLISKLRIATLDYLKSNPK